LLSVFGVYRGRDENRFRAPLPETLPIERPSQKSVSLRTRAPEALDVR
jgi:hypothetical protein